jgi:hypothetical protein
MEKRAVKEDESPTPCFKGRWATSCGKDEMNKRISGARSSFPFETGHLAKGVRGI